MEDRLHSEIRHIISSYIADKQELSSVQNWLWPLMADMEDSDDEAAISVVGRIGNLISEYSDGYMTEAELRKELAAAISPFADPAVPAKAVIAKLIQLPGKTERTESMGYFQWNVMLLAPNENAGTTLAWGTAGSSNSAEPISPQRETVSAFGSAFVKPAALAVVL